MQKLPLSDEINMTQGMKEALLFILDQWELEVKETNAEEKSVVLMYYGVPCIGKSTLASALDYYLGLVHGKIWFAQLVHCPKSDSGAILKKIFEHPSDDASNPMNEVYIIDQVNPGVIDVTGLINKCRSRPYPVIMFTSGHYMPSPSWTQTDRVKVTGIHMTIEINEVQRLYNKIDQNILKDFLEESAVYGQVSKMAFRYAGTENFDEAVSTIRIDYDKMNVALLQVLFTRLFLNFKVWRTFEEMTDRNGFIMEVEDFMHYQQHMKTEKDVDDTNVNSFIHQFVPLRDDEDIQASKNQPAFKSFEMSKVRFYNSQDKHFFEYFSKTATSKTDIYNSSLKLFGTEGLVASLKGQCYELMIKLQCQIEERGMNPGRFKMTRSDESIKTTILEAHSAETLVDKMVCDDNDCGKSHEMRFWVSLDVIGKPRYKGFDFVCAEGKFDHAANQFRLSTMKLIQATVSLASKTKDKRHTMVVEFNHIVRVLIEKKCINDNVDDIISKVQCVFCLPEKGFAQEDRTESLESKDRNLNLRVHKLEATVVTTKDFEPK